MGDGDGVQEAEAAQQPAGEPGSVTPGGFVGQRLALVFPTAFVGGPGVASEPARLAAVVTDALGERGFGLLEGASGGPGEPDAGRLSEAAKLDAALASCRDPAPVEAVDLVVAATHAHPPGQQAGQQVVEVRVALQVEPDAVRGGLHVLDTEGELEEVPLGAENPVEHLGLEEQLLVVGGSGDEKGAPGKAGDDLARQLAGSSGVEGVRPGPAAGLGGRHGGYLSLRSVGPRSVRNRHWCAVVRSVRWL
ncbi:hypothetical protein GCM10010250_69120 [Streptomyces althioticus]|nr:hypothetical protein GCM10010250_69120 [Streptomyces althioticus]